MNNPYSQEHLQQYPENQRSDNQRFGQNRNERWGSDNYRGQSNWRDDMSRTPNRPAWGGEQTGYGQPQQNFSGQGEHGQDYDDYGYYANEFPESQRGSSNQGYENYGGQQSRNAQWRNQNRGGSQPWEQQGQRWGQQGREWQQPWQGRSQADSDQLGYRQQPWSGQSGQSNSGGQYYGNQNYGRENFGAQPYGSQNYGSSQNYSGGSQNYGGQNFGAQQGADYSFGRQSAGSFQSGGGAYGLQTHRGKGPKGYVRTDERIREEICECLSDEPSIDASEITVEVREGVVTLEGSVQDRMQKHRVEDIADSCSGVKDVHNGLRVTRQAGGQNQNEGQTATSEKGQEKSSSKTATRQ